MRRFRIYSIAAMPPTTITTAAMIRAHCVVLNALIFMTCLRCFHESLVRAEELDRQNNRSDRIGNLFTTGHF